MCRWIAYVGEPIFMDRLVTKPAHSLVEQSMNAELQFRDDGSLWTTNGDGFGVGWYGKLKKPGLFKDASPAWNDRNLHEICAQTETPLFFAHIRASTQGAVQRDNSHPFKYKNWLFQHNGTVENFKKIKRALHNDMDTEFYENIKGTTDSETCFYMALNYGLLDDPKEAFQKTLGRLKQAQEEAGLEEDLSFSASATDGKSVYTFRYSSPTATTKSQFFTKNMSLFEDIGGAQDAVEQPDTGVLVVSEPLLDRLSGEWEEVPEGSFMTIKDNHVELEGFRLRI